MSTVIENNIIPLYINSADRIDIDDSTSDFTIGLRKSLRNISSINVSNVVIPRKDTELNSNNNVIDGCVNIDGVLTSFELTIPPGNYSETELAAELKTQLDANEILGTFGFVWSVSYDSSTQRLLISLTYIQGALLNSWGFDIKYTPLVDILGLGDAGTTTRNFLTSLTDELTIETGRAPTIQRALVYNIVSKALTNSINTSYISSLGRPFDIDDTNNTIILNTLQDVTDQKYDVPLGAETDLTNQMRGGSMSGDGNIIVSGSENGIFVFTRTLVGGFWVQRIPVLTGTGSEVTLNEFGLVGAKISRDGSTMVAGISSDDSSTGALWIFTRNGLSWTQQGTKLLGTGSVGNSGMGQVGISADGNTVAAGGISDDSARGAVWVFVRTGTTWAQQGAKLVPSDLAGAGSSFGREPALSDDGNTLVVGSGHEGVWVFVRTGTTWAQQGLKIVGSPFESVKNYGATGASLSADGDTMAYSAHRANSDVGYIFVFTRTGSTWSQQGAALVPSDVTGAARIKSPMLSSDGDTMYFGGEEDDSGKGAGWIFTRSGSVWTQQGSKFITSDDTGDGVTSAKGMSSDGSLVVMQSPEDNSEVGAVWVFENKGGTAVQVGNKIIPSQQEGNALQGSGFAMSRDNLTCFISGSQNRCWTYIREGTQWRQVDTFAGVDTFRKHSLSDDGLTLAVSRSSIESVDVYVRSTNTSTWTLEQTLTGTGGIGTPLFGFSVSLSGDGKKMAVGGRADNSDKGAFWIFQKSGTVWTQQGSKIVPVDLVGSPRFGQSIQMNQLGTEVYIGGPRDSSNTGAVWFYEEIANIWTNSQKLVGTGASGAAQQGRVISISTDGNTLSFSGFRDFSDRGAVWVFVKTAGVWVQQGSKLFATDYVGDIPGQGLSSLSEDGNVMVVGAENQGLSGRRTGAYWIWRRTGTTWALDGGIRIEDGIGYGGQSVGQIFEDASGVMITAPYNGGNISGGFGGKGAVFYRVFSGEYETSYTVTIPTKIYTIFDLINTLKDDLKDVDGLGNFTLDAVFDGENIVTLGMVSNNPDIVMEFRVDASGSTFEDITWTGLIRGASQVSNAIDMTINNNIIKSIVDHSDNEDGVLVDNRTSLISRKYKAGFTLEDDVPIDIQLKDERDRIVSLQGANWVMTIFATIHT